MESLYLFLFILFLSFVGFAILAGSSSREEIMNNWEERRCDFTVLLASFNYKPDSDTRSSSEFASDNFSYCVSEIAANQMKIIFSPLFELLKSQMQTADLFSDIMNQLRLQFKNIFTPFSSLMNSNWVKFKQIGFLFNRIFQHLNAGMNQAGGLAAAAMYAGISLMVGMINAIDFVVNVIIIILFIIFSLVILYYAPVIPAMFFIVLAMVGIEIAFPGRLGGKGFCFIGDTPIVLRNSTTKPIREIKKGDILKGGGTVETVIKIDNNKEELYVLDGITVTGSHKIWSEEKQSYIYVKVHPDAVESDEDPSIELWDLKTTNNIIPVKGNSGILQFSDWEELPQHWCFIPETPILMKTGTTLQIQSIQLGDILIDDSVVEAVLQVPGNNECLYEYKGIYVSGAHRVWSQERKEFIPIKEEPLARKTTQTVPVLWSLITSTRIIPIQGLDSRILFADWEELPNTEQATKQWDALVRLQLNKKDDDLCKIPKNAPCLDPTLQVIKKIPRLNIRHFTVLQYIQAGDYIWDGTAYTKVLGICKRRVSGYLDFHGKRITDGVWIEGSDGDWEHLYGIHKENSWDGLQLITESGSFSVYSPFSKTSIRVRDFTEVGSILLANTFLMEHEISG
jgi:hypothetical protein